MITVKRKLHLSREAHGQRRVKKASPETKKVETGRIPRVARLMATAIRLEGMLQSGEVETVTELAGLAHVSQPRMSQLLALTLLAPDIQEVLLFLPRITAGKTTIHERLLRPVAREVDWEKQREMWSQIRLGYV